MEVDTDFTIWMLCNYCSRAFWDVDRLLKHKVNNHIHPKRRITCKTKCFDGNFIQTRSRRVPVVTVVPEVRTKRARKRKSSWIIEDALHAVKALSQEFVLEKYLSVPNEEEKAASVSNSEDTAVSVSNQEEDKAPSVTSDEKTVPDTKEETENSSSISFNKDEILYSSKPKTVLKQLHNQQLTTDDSFTAPCIDSSVPMLTCKSKAPQYRDFIYVRNQDSIDELEHEVLAKKNNRVESSIIGCPICAVDLLSRNSLLSHLTRGCLKCPSCKAKVSNDNSEYNSISTHFEKSPKCYPLKCHTCEQLYHSYNSLRGHALVHAYDPKAFPLFKTYA